MVDSPPRPQPPHPSTSSQCY